ncbi:EAL domain-containing protein [Escherichia coli]|uniref:EAL domain-containing protein n=1 Tax=Escherichia coli TaxID=562 RepID=UPI003CC91324
MNAPDKLPPETRQPVSTSCLWGALAVLTCPTICRFSPPAGRATAGAFLGDIGVLPRSLVTGVRSGRNAAAARSFRGGSVASSQPAGWTAAELAQAAARGQLDLHYQPLVDLRDHRIAGAEALMLAASRLGLLPPGQFPALAESVSA